jgi:hypothetical protein
MPQPALADRRLSALELQHVERQVLADVGADTGVERDAILVVFDGVAAALDANRRAGLTAE